jgi:outer membrane protein
MARMATVVLLLCCTPLFAQKRVDLIVDAEGVRRTGENTSFTPGTRFDPSFSTGGGLGLGIDWFTSDRVSFELKVAALESDLTVRTIGSDFILVAQLGHAQVYPVTALVKWHVLEHGSLRPYLGIGAAYVILRDIERQTSRFSGINFKDPIGLAIDGGLMLELSRRWALSGDVRYVPIETSSRASFAGTESSVELNVKPLIVGFGIGYRF